MRSRDLAATGPLVLVMMGVTGCGKSTVGALLSDWLNWPFEEGERRPGLDAVVAWVDDRLAAEENGVITYPALRRAHRDRLTHLGRGVVFVHLAGDRDLIARRLTARPSQGPHTLLDGQLAELELPTLDEPTVRVDVGRTPTQIADEIRERLHL